MNVLIIDHPRNFSVEHYNDVANAPLAASLNCGYAYSVAEKAGHQVTYLDYLSSPETPEKMATESLKSNPDLVLLHWVYDWSDCQQVIRYLKNIRKLGYSGIIAAFGLFPSFCYQDLITRTSELDLILKGEFEATLADVLETIANGNTVTALPGTVDQNGTYHKRQLISDANTIPFPKDLGKTANLKYINVTGSRGCYGDCSFCCIQPFYSMQKWRGRSVDNIIQEIKRRLHNRQNGYVYFCDPNFFGPGKNGQERAKMLAEELKKLNIRFGLEARVNDIHDDTIALLAEAGLESVFLGIESGCQTVLTRMRKHITPEQSENAVRILRKYNIHISVGFIMFEPDSTLDEVKENFNFLKRNELLNNHDLTANVLYHKQIVFKGTPSFDHFQSLGRMKLNPNSPYEAEITYKHDNVRLLNEAIGKLTLSYFQNIAKLWQDYGHSDLEQFENCHCCAPVALPDNEINSLLVNAFEEMLLLAENKLHKLNKTVDTYIQHLNKLMTSA